MKTTLFSICDECGAETRTYRQFDLDYICLDCEAVRFGQIPADNLDDTTEDCGSDDFWARVDKAVAEMKDGVM